MFKKIIIGLLLAAMLIALLSSILYASSTIDTTQKASLTIIEYENIYKVGEDSSQNKPLKDVEITIYKLTDENYDKTVTELENALSNGELNLIPISQTTGEDGKTQFTNLDLGRYLVVETNSPERISVKMESFLIDLPRTSNDGNSWIYDVTVEPKNVTIYGDVLLTNTNKTSTPLFNVSWTLQKKNAQNVWENFGNTLKSNTKGQVKASNLPIGNYRFIMASVPTGYILDCSNIQEFEITKDNYSISLSAIIDRPRVETHVKLSNDYGCSVGANIQDITEWKVSADLPSIIKKMETFSIRQSISNKLDLIDDSLMVYGDNILLNPDTYYTYSKSTENNETVLTVNFIPQNLENFNSVYFTYSTKFNNTITYGEALKCMSKLIYTNSINTNQESLTTDYMYSYTAEVHTGALTIKCVDSSQIPLSGAKFKISKTKEDAQNNFFIKDPNKNDNSDLIATSNEDGFLTFYGLKYGNDNENASYALSKYYVTEIESPTYEENGETRHYQLLSDSVELNVNANSGKQEDNSYKVIHKKNYNLPITGSNGIIGLVLVGCFIIIVAIRKNKKDGKNKN